MYEVDALELSATLAGKNPLAATSHSKIEESITMVRYRYLAKMDWQMQMITGTECIFIYLGEPLGFHGRHSASAFVDAST